jgi:hypothetical protein
MSDTFAVTLNNSLTMSIVEHVDYDTGVITYTVKGKRLAGAVTVYHRYDNGNETMPSRIFLTSDSYKYKTISIKPRMARRYSHDQRRQN